MDEGHEVLVIDNYATGRRDNLTERDGLEIVEDTIEDADAVMEAFEGFRPDFVVHAAAAYKDPEAWGTDVTTNALGTVNVVKAAQATGVQRLLYFQTALCYGTTPTEQPVTLSPPDPARLELRHLQDGGRAVHRAVGRSTSSRSGSPTRTGRATSPARCRPSTTG